MDTRPVNCRFRLQDEGKPYPRSSCAACGRTVLTGLGNKCGNSDQSSEVYQPTTAEVDGEPPHPKKPTGPVKAQDMTLRDWFAGQALAAIIAKSPFKSGTLAEMKASGDIEARAASAYDYADAMLAERSKP